MSIATLKKKTNAQYNNLSVGKPHFSINGTLRNQGYVGQTSLSRSLPRTLFRGSYPRGHGGCCGTFHIGQVVQSGILPLNDPSVIKSSVINTKGMLQEEAHGLNSLRIQGWNRRLPCNSQCNTVKPDNNQHTSDQSTYITNTAKKTIQQYNTCTPDGTIKKQGTCETDVIVSKKLCNFTKDSSQITAVSQEMYIKQLGNKCVNNDTIVPKKTMNMPLPNNN